MLDEVDNLVAVAPFVVIPRDQLDEGGGQLDAGSGVEDGGAGVGDEVGGNDGVFGVADDALPALGLGGFLHRLLDLVHGGGGLEVDGQVNDGDVSGGHAEGHAGQLAVQFGDHHADGLGRASGGRDDVERRAAAAAPVLLGRAVNGLLGSGGGMHGGHEAVGDAELLIDNAGKRRQAVGGAARVGHDLHVLGVLFVVHAHDEHRSFLVLGGGGDDDLLGAADEVGGSLFGGGEHAGGLDDIFGAGLGPRDFLRVHAGIHLDGVAVDNQIAVLDFDGALELAVHGVIAEHVDHVIHIDEGIVDRVHFDVGVRAGGAENETANAAKTVDANFNHTNFLLKWNP